MAALFCLFIYFHLFCVNLLIIFAQISPLINFINNFLRAAPLIAWFQKQDGFGNRFPGRCCCCMKDCVKEGVNLYNSLNNK